MRVPQTVAMSLLVLILAFRTFVSAADTVGDNINWPKYLARHDMVWQRLRKSGQEAPHFGNAMLGSMLFRSGEGDKLRSATQRQRFN